MEKQNYFDALGRHQTLQAGLAAYLSPVIQSHAFERNHAIPAGPPSGTFLAYIASGSARFYAQDLETHQQHTLEFYLSGTFLPCLASATENSRQAYHFEFLESSLILGISEKHYLYLPTLFKQCVSLYNSIQQKHYLDQLQRIIERGTTSASERYQDLSRTRPALLLLAPVKDLASYLGIHPNTLSALRSKR